MSPRSEGGDYTCTTFVATMSCFSTDVTGPLGTIPEGVGMFLTSATFGRGLPVMKIKVGG